jgi:Protein of unknown function (DUF2752)
MEERIEYYSGRAWRLTAAAGVVGIGAASAMVAYFNPVTAGFFPTCPLYQATGLYCPGCGLTRGFHALFNGDIPRALHFNVLLPVYVFIFCYFIVSLVLFAARGRGLTFKVFKPWMAWSFFLVSITFAVLRNLPYYPFTTLAP